MNGHRPCSDDREREDLRLGRQTRRLGVGTGGGSPVNAVLLAGGRARRLGGIDKPLLTIGGRTLLAGCVDALLDAGISRIVAVGPMLDADAPVTWVREEPPYGGPVAAIATALPLIAAEWTLVLAGDLEHPDVVVARLVAAISDDSGAEVDGVAFIAQGHEQWLAGAYRTGALRDALAAVDTQTGISVRSALTGLGIALIVDEDGVARDIDTPADLDRARAEHEEPT